MKVWFKTSNKIQAGMVVYKGTDETFGQEVGYAIVRVKNSIGHTDSKVYDTQLNDDRRDSVR